MTTFVLIHGAGDGAWYWHLLVAELRRRGHDTIAVDLPRVPFVQAGLEPLCKRAQLQAQVCIRGCITGKTRLLPQGVGVTSVGLHTPVHTRRTAAVGFDFLLKARAELGSLPG